MGRVHRPLGDWTIRPEPRPIQTLPPGGFRIDKMAVTEAHIPAAGRDSGTGPDSQRLTEELSRLDATVHTLNARFAQERMRVAQAHGDLEAFTFWLQDAE